jgi:GT2 family glycosyltransferase
LNTPSPEPGDGSPSAVRATIVMTARERHGLTERAIDSILRNTACPYRLVYADGSTPDALRERLQARAADGSFEVVRVDPDLWPTHVRRKLVATVDSDYVVFVDNDVIVEPGWLEALIACADETGAGAVGPLYLIGGGDAPTRVHMAGGTLEWIDTPTGRVLRELHVDAGSDPGKLADATVRAPCGYVEYHCVLVRTAAARDGAPFDPEIFCVHEHIDLALTLAQRGYATWSEPRARVTYLATEPWALGELAFRRRRWSLETGNASIAAFCRKWGVADDERSFGGVRAFLREHVRLLDPLRPEAIGRRDLGVAMRPEELVQTRSALLDLAFVRGYAPQDRATIAHHCDVAAILMNGGYRPCGRPFVSHLIGTAGVLVRYGFRVEVVLAGLLHAAYTHCPELPPGQKSSIETVRDVLGGAGAPLERRVRAYSRRGENLDSLASRLDRVDEMSVDDAEIVALVAANEVDMMLGGEYRYTMRDDAMGADGLALVSRVCTALGVPGLTATLEAGVAAPPAPPELRTRTLGSYRIVGLDRRPMVSRAFAEFDRSAREPKPTD